MIDAGDANLYQESLLALRRHKSSVGRQFKGRFIQIFLALKFYQNAMPSMFSGSFVPTEILQTMFDELYAKASRPLNNAVLVLFDNAYLARTGLVGPNNSTPQNTWRNNFNLQKGVGCYAPPSELAMQTFLDESRIDCRHLAPATAGSLLRARCSMCPSGATYRNEDHRKWLHIDPNGNGYSVTDLLNTRNFEPYVVPSGHRIPALPLAVALYHDGDPSLLVGQRPRFDIDDFRNDFNFAMNEFNSYFDDDLNAPANQALLARFPHVTYTRASAATPAALPPPSRPGRPTPAPVLVPPGTVVTPPAANTGFDAEQFVSKALDGARWTVYNVTRQQLGYDFLVKRGTSTRYIEVKSSLGRCTPSLTSREWHQAQVHGASYVLAVIENFAPLSVNTIYWVPDPASSCVATQSQTVNYAIPRSSWVGATVDLSTI